MGTRTLQTFEQFEQYPDDGMKHELIQGEHIVVPPAKSRHTRIQQKLQDAIRPYVLERQLGEVHIEAGFKLSPDTWLQPDVSFLRTPQIEASYPNRYFEGAPEIAIEVLSESNTPAKIAKKTEQYLEHGSGAVWVVDPNRREICVHRRDGVSQTVAGGELQSDLLPGLSIDIAPLFEN